MDSLRLAAKRENVIAITTQLVTFLNSHSLAGWSPRFREIIVALQQGDDSAAIALEDAIPRVNMGSFGDFYVDDIDGESEGHGQRQFECLNSAVIKAITNLRLYVTYEIDRPLVEL